MGKGVVANSFSVKHLRIDKTPRMLKLRDHEFENDARLVRENLRWPKREAVSGAQST